MNLQVLDREKVIKIITILRKTGDSRKLSYKHISECPFNIESTAAIESNNIDIIVYFDDSILLSLQEEAIIHELLHILVRNDGFPEAIVSNTFLSNNPKARRMTTGCQFTLTSIIQHPEILRREMEIFDIDENLIFAHTIKMKKRLLNARPETFDRNLTHFFNQQEILEIFECHFYPEQYKQNILSIYQKESPISYKSTLKLMKSISIESMYYPKGCKSSAIKLLKHVINYGKKHMLKTSTKYNEIWKHLSIS